MEAVPLGLCRGSSDAGCRECEPGAGRSHRQKGADRYGQFAIGAGCRPRGDGHLGAGDRVRGAAAGDGGPGGGPVPNDEESVRRLIGRLGDRRLLAVCYEAGPSGYELHRLLSSMGVACEVIAPSLVPKGASDRVKTDRRDAVRLTLALRAGMLTPVRVPSPSEEAVRDLVRARGDLLDDRRRAQQRLGAFLLRHGRVWGGDEVDLRPPGLGRPAGVRRAGDAGDAGRLPRRPGGAGGRAARGRGPAGRLGRAGAGSRRRSRGSAPTAASRS